MRHRTFTLVFQCCIFLKYRLKVSPTCYLWHAMIERLIRIWTKVTQYLWSVLPQILDIIFRHGLIALDWSWRPDPECHPKSKVNVNNSENGYTNARWIVNIIIIWREKVCLAICVQLRRRSWMLCLSNKISKDQIWGTPPLHDIGTASLANHMAITTWRHDPLCRDPRKTLKWRNGKKKSDVVGKANERLDVLSFRSFPPIFVIAQ